jgi:hypothetical protein
MGSYHGGAARDSIHNTIITASTTENVATSHPRQLRGLRRNANRRPATAGEGVGIELLMEDPAHAAKKHQAA